MADKIFHSSAVTFVDMTDERKLDIYISSNHPTVQLCNANKTPLEYTPDWSVNNLQLDASFYLDSAEIQPETIGWYTRIGTNETLVGSLDTLTISTNVLESNPIVTYICKAKYQNIEALKEITFARVDTGLNGTNAPTVQAQYSADGKTGWTSVLNTATHKYIRYSYDGGKTWTTAIKMVGEDGTSVNIKGTATSKTTVSGTSYYTLVYNSTTITGATIGDAYLLDGNLYVCVNSRDGNDYFMDVGHIQGPQGNDGTSSYVFIRYATDASGSNMSANPNSATTHIGICTVNTNVAPTTASSYTWSKFVGDSAKSIVLNGSSQIFKVTQGTTTTYSPTTITVIAQAINTTVAKWEYSVNGGVSWTETAPSGISLNSSTNTITVTGASLASNSIVIKASNGSYSDTYTVYKVFDGINGAPGNPGTPASIAFLTNENISFGANASGQVALTSFTTNVVAYTGTTKVTPTLGTITGLPSGMTVATPVTTANEQILTFSIANNSTLGSSSSNNGTITIPVTSPVSTNLILSWSKINTGATGVGIESTTVSYGESDSSSVQPTSWQSTIPDVAEGKYLWTRTIIDYTDTNKADTVTYTYAKQGTKGDEGKSGTSVTVSSIQYQEGSSATTAPTGTWSNVVVAAAEGKYLWTKTVFSDGKTAYGVAKQGAQGTAGKGVVSIIEQYYQSTSATSQTNGSWSTTVPTWADGKYIWTRSVITYTDSTTYTTSPVCVTGQKGGTGGIGATGVGVSSVDVWYYQSTSSTALSGDSWSTTAPTWSDGKYVWTKTITTYTDSTTDETAAVCITGQKGSTGVGIKSVTEYYLATASGSDVTISTSGWTTAIQTITTDKKYLWNYEVVTYTNNTTSTTTPVIIGVFGNTGNTGKGIKSVTEYYLATTASSGITTSTTGWKDTMQALSATNKYLWNYELITYTDNTTATIAPVIIGVYGDQGIQGPKGNDAYTVILTNESHIFAGDVSNAIAGTAETQVLAYNGSTQQSVTITSVNGKTAATADTDTGIAGLKFKCSALSGTSPKITFTCTTAFVSMSGSIPIVLSVGGVQFTKMFTYSIAFKGTAGSPGTPASLVDITPSAYYFKSTTGKDGTFTPDYIYLYPRFQAVTFSKWEYSVNGGTTWVAASGANGLTISTYNSIANTLRIAKTSTLYTDIVTSISFRCVSSNASVYDTVSIAKIYDVVDLQIGGRNYIKNSAQEITKEVGVAQAEYLSLPYDLTPLIEEYGVDQTYTLSFDLKSKNITNNNKINVYPEPGTTPPHKYAFPNTAFVVTQEYQRFSITFKPTRSSNENATATRISVYGTYDTGNIPVIKNLKLELGNKATDWSPAPEDLTSTTFQIYAPDGYVLSNKLESLTLQTFAYEGSAAITSATYEWSYQENDEWVTIADATTNSLTVIKEDVIKTKTYRCEMTYKDKTYYATTTVQDISDVYEALICVSDNVNPLTGIYYWVVYALLYSEQGEADALLGPISIDAPASPASGDYWYAVDGAAQTVTLKKYNGSAWVVSTDKQAYEYDWSRIVNGSQHYAIGNTDKVQIISCNSFTSNATFQCVVTGTDGDKLARCNVHLTDTSDPIVSSTAPTGVKDGQLWMQTQTDGTFLMYIWDADTSIWKQLNADTKNVVHTKKPSSYKTGDLWVVESDTAITGYTKGTLLQANATSTTFAATHWSPSLKYEDDIKGIQNALKSYEQYMTVDSDGLHMRAKNSDGTLSPFQALFTNTRLSFFQDDLEVAYISDNKLNIYEASIDVLAVEKKIQLQSFEWAVESNGSMSLIVNY